MDKRFMAILAAIIIIFVGIFAFSKHSDNSNSSSSNGQPTSHIEGKGSKSVTLVEYGDYQCPVCEAYHQILEQVEAKYTNDIYFQFRNLPLVSIHKNAYAAARAAEAAGQQNKYFEMHRQLYDATNWQAWTVSSSPTSYFQNYAQTLGLDLNKYNSDYNSNKVNDLINADIAEFNKTGQQMATPAFFLNGKYIANSSLADQNGPSVEKFSTLLDAEIAKKQ